VTRTETQHASQAGKSAADVADSGDAIATGHPLGSDPRLSPGHLHAVHPDHGEPVTYQPGELLPDWVLGELAAGATLKIDGPGVFTLVTTKGGKR
jgi:hypothetical protein